jgi:hypothetical protein
LKNEAQVFRVTVGNNFFLHAYKTSIDAQQGKLQFEKQFDFGAASTE